jgi:D-alanyl-D-alanine carboxypeptidase
VVRTISYHKTDRPTPLRPLWTYDRTSVELLLKLRHRLGESPARADPLPAVKAASYVALCSQTLALQLARAPEVRREIASLTKVFTCYCCLLLCQKYDVSLAATVRVSERAAALKGTSAELQPGDHLTLMDLLHGLMLPSGNDAAMAISEFCGEVIQKQAQSRCLDSRRPRRTFNRCFLAQLNKLIRDLKLTNTYLANPHGLMNHCSFSTAQDVAAFCWVALRHPLFKRIVSTQQHCCVISNNRTGLTRTVLWRNTNRLLKRGPFFGIKTGVTPAAGPCLAALFEQGQQAVITIILKTTSMAQRFDDTEHLVEEATGSPLALQPGLDSSFTDQDESNAAAD